MKHSILSALFIFSASFAFAQTFPLEKQYPAAEKVYVTYLEGSGVKYYSYKTTISPNGRTASVAIKLYDANHVYNTTINSPTINTGQKSSIGSVSVDNVTTMLFNTTSDIEYSLRYSVYDTVGTYTLPCTGCTYKSIQYSPFVKVCTAAGAIIFSADTSDYAYIGADEPFASFNTRGISKIEGKMKLNIDSYNVADGVTVSKNQGNWYKGEPSTFVYALPGNFAPPLAVNDEKLSDKDKAMLSYPMPNPSSESTRIEFQLPKETEFGEITVYNDMGLKVKSYKVDNTFGDLILNNADLPTGSYNYQLVAGGKRVLATKKGWSSSKKERFKMVNMKEGRLYKPAFFVKTEL